MRVTEKEFMSQVTQLARLCGWLVYHTHDSRRSVSGFPDLILIRSERLLAIELKVGKNRATPEQHQWLSAFQGAGAVAAIWTPELWPQIELELRR